MIRKAGIVLLCLPALILAEENTWKTRFGLSFVNTSGNTSTQTFSGKLDVDGSGLGNRYALASHYVLARNEGKEIVNKLNSALRVERVFTGRLFGFLAVTHLTDKFSGYDSRISVGPGLGMDILRQEKQSLKGMLSSMYYFDDYALKGLESDRYPTAKAALNYEWKLTETARFKWVNEGLVSLEDSDRYFMTSDASLQVSLSGSFAIGIGYQIAYQNKPPAAGIRKTDTTFLTSLVINR